MQVGNRIFYNQDGKILFETGERQGDVSPNEPIASLQYIDLNYGQIDYAKYKIASIDINSKQPILEEIPYQPTYEELQQQLLIAQGVI